MLEQTAEEIENAHCELGVAAVSQPHQRPLENNVQHFQQLVTLLPHEAGEGVDALYVLLEVVGEHLIAIRLANALYCQRLEFVDLICLYVLQLEL